MTDEKLLEIIEGEPKSTDDVILKVYQLGRLIGRNECRMFADPSGYDTLCDFAAEMTERFAAKLRWLWLGVPREKSTQADVSAGPAAALEEPLESTRVPL